MKSVRQSTYAVLARVPVGAKVTAEMVRDEEAQ